MMICPIMSRPIATLEPDDIPRIDVEWVPCQKEKCALWTGLYVREGDKVIGPEYGCAIVQIAKKQADGTISA